MKTHETKQNTKKGLFLLALTNTYNVKKFIVQSVGFNKAGCKTPLTSYYFVLEKITVYRFFEQRKLSTFF